MIKNNRDESTGSPRPPSKTRYSGSADREQGAAGYDNQRLCGGERASMKRRLLSVAAALSLLVCVAATALWVCSSRMMIGVCYAVPTPPSPEESGISAKHAVAARDGSLRYAHWRSRDMRAGWE